jgi:hypothetical protein
MKACHGQHRVVHGSDAWCRALGELVKTKSLLLRATVERWLAYPKQRVCASELGVQKTH